MNATHLLESRPASRPLGSRARAGGPGGPGGLRSLLGLGASAALAAGLAATLAAPAALAAQDDAGASALTWEAPSAAAQVDASVLTAGAHSSATALPDILGINSTVLPATQIKATTLDEARGSARLGVYGTDANQSPNPYLHNLFYNAYAAANGLDAAEAAAVSDTVGRSPSSFNEMPESGWGVPADLAWRPDLVVGVNTSVGNVYQVDMNQDTTTAVNYATWGTGATIPSQPYQYVLDIRRHTASDELVGTLNSDGNEYVKSDYYRVGDETFDPIAVSYDEGSTSATAGLDYLVGDVNELAWGAKRALYQDSSRTTRYGDVYDIAGAYEQYVKATKWYVLKQLDAGAITRKKVAVITGVNKPAADGGAYTFTAAKLNPDGDASPVGTLRMLEAVQDTVDDVVALCYPDASAGTLRAAQTLTAEQLMAADVVVCIPSLTTLSTYGAADVEEALAAAGYTSETSGYPAIFDACMPLGTFQSDTGFSMSAEAGLLVGVLQGFVYPEAVDPVASMTYFSSKFFHLKDSYLESFVKAQLAGVSLPAGLSLDAASYDQGAIDAVQARLDEGCAYYYANKASIDAKRPRIASSDMLDDLSGQGVAQVKLSVPAGADVQLLDEHGLVVQAGADGAYTLDTGADAVSTLTVSLAGYRDYVKRITGAEAASGAVSVAQGDLTPAKTVTFSIPEAASIKWVRDASEHFIRKNANGTYTVDTGQTATFAISLEGHDDYEGTIAESQTSVVLAEADFPLKSTFTTINVPAGATLQVTGPDGAEVTPEYDGTYRLRSGLVYTLAVEHPRYKPYTTTVVGGASDKVSVRLADMTQRAGAKTLTLNKATVSAEDIDDIDAATVQTIKLGAKVKTIAAGALRGLPKLKTVTFGKNVVKIGASAFAGCKLLKAVTLPAKVKSIGAQAFAGCKKMTKLTLKTKKLTKKSVAKALRNSSVKTVKVSVGKAKLNKAYVKKYAKFFTRANCGKKVNVK